MSITILPDQFTLAHYRFHLTAQEELHLPPLKGSALRGGFGHVFKRLACLHSPTCSQSCRRGNACAYGYIFETEPPPGSEVLRNFSEVPRPFVIAAPAQDTRRRIAAGQELIFNLTLLGRGIQHFPYFLVVFRELGQVGLGHTRGKYELAIIEAVQPYTNATTVLYQAESETLGGTDLAIDASRVALRAESLPVNRLTVEFTSPIRLKHQGQWITQGPSFQTLIKTLLGRISSLSYFHCGQRWEVDFRGLIDRAAEVRLATSQTHWEEWTRFSSRQQQWIELSGLMGRATYEGNLVEYREILALGELIHAGKGTVFGNGQYRIMRD